MNIGIIGSGGREHALCKKISESSLVNKIVCFPGNPGTSKFATNIDIDILDFKKLLQFIRLLKIDFIIVGPEEPLVKGIVNYLKKYNIKVFGPNKYASKLEGSKAFMKRICLKNNIPTAKFKICSKLSQVKKFLNQSNFPIVAKADGLAAGKGVFICKNKNQLINSAKMVFNGKFKSSKKIVLEEFLDGEEASFFLIVDKFNYKIFGTAQDHKRVGEKDKGPNTGGMGAYSPAPIINKVLTKKIIEKIVKPTLSALKRKNNYYSGFLYVGLMIKNGEPYLIEYNIRMGDPECQVILPLLKSDLLKVLISCENNKLNDVSLSWSNKKSMTIVLCSKGYPGKYKKNIFLKNIQKIKLNNNDYIYHAGTIIKNNKIFSNGGRILNITSIGKDFKIIRKKIISILRKLNYKEGFYRRDIGWRVIK